ncbi:hypothetical protein FHS18_004831 [Paenibacillus phyllosphaerae]|uniref:Uncharacterized protein n=1 Tax=Paenibacillus phyllosphaerae TaxID=274593 RepID=A0A7W5B1H6_9BACL|nr:hypothetical protein [Paenibacillus phyllosphaerae]MBB3112729.1 hypothetical protein [Paenibacillus phyllosphaerae]
MLVLVIDLVVALLLVYLLVEGERQGWWNKWRIFRPILVIGISLACVAGVWLSMSLLDG